MTDLRINADRFLQMMDEQAQIGGTAAGGLSRPALSETDVAVREWFKSKIAEYNGDFRLEYHMDGAGNQSVVLPSDDPDAKTLLIGSHFDSVPNGGRFDGPLGVLSAFETLLTINEAGFKLPFHLEVINLTDEEGTLQGLLGSSALIGKITAESIKTPRGGYDNLVAGLERIGLTPDSVLTAQRDPDSLVGYIEVHIEQGTRLESSQTDIGVVNSIVGIRTAWLTFTGEAAHAGTMPMDQRKDAFWGATHFVHQARERVMQAFSPGVVNFGKVDIAPSAFNIVPAEVKLAMEYRHGDLASFDAMEAALLDLAQASADAYNVALNIEKVSSVTPAPMADSFIEAVEAAATSLGLSHTRLMSFAGHDAQSLAAITNSVMYFVPSVDGISHNPKEFTKPEDCVNAANVMLQSVLKVAETMAG